MRNDKDGLGGLVIAWSCGIAGETWWREPHSWGAGTESYRLFRRGRRGGGVAPCVREKCERTALTVRGDLAESLRGED